MAFIGSDLGLVVIDGLTNATGSVFLSLLALILIFTVIAIGLRIPLEFSAVIVLPMLLVVASYTSDILPILGVALIYLGFLLGRYIITR